MTRDLPFDADAEDPGDDAGDTAYRVATGVARVARAGAYVTGGALIAEGSGNPPTTESHDASRIAGWSVTDPQPNAPSPVVTYPDPSPDSVPPVLGHPAPSAAAGGPLPGQPNLAPGFEFHIQINPGPDSDHAPGMPDADSFPGMNGIPGTDDGTPGLSMVPGTDDGSVPGGPGTGHLPGTGDVPGAGDGVPGLGNGIPGLDNGIPGVGKIPGTGDSPFGLPSVPSTLSAPSMPSVPSVPGLRIPDLNSGNGTGFGLPGLHPSAAPIAADGSPDAVLTSLVHPAGAPIAGSAGFGPIDLGDQSVSPDDGAGPNGSDADVPHMFSGSGLPGFHLPGLLGFEGAGFDLPASGYDGIGSLEVGAYPGVQMQADGHEGLDKVWLSVQAQADAGVSVVGEIGQHLDNYGRWLGGESTPETPQGSESAIPGLDVPASGIWPGMGVPGANSGPGHFPGGAPVASPGAVGGAPGALPGPALPGMVQIGLPGAAVPTGVASSAPVVSTVAPVTASFSPSLPAGPATSAFVPATVAAPAAVTMTVAPAPAPSIVPPAPPVPQPVVTTPLQTSVHSDPTVQVLAGVLPDHLGPVPLGPAAAAAAVGPAAFLNLPHPVPAAAASPAPATGGDHTAAPGTPVAQPLTGPFPPFLVPHISIPPLPGPAVAPPSHTPSPAHATFGPAVPSHQSGASGEPTPAGTGTDGSATSTSTVAEHPSPALTVGVTPATHSGSASGTSDPTSSGHQSATPTQASTPAHDSSPAYGPTASSGPAATHGPTTTYDSGPTRESVPGHDSPMPSLAPSWMPTAPGHDSPPAMTAPQVPGEHGTVPTVPHPPILPPTLEPGIHIPTKPIAAVVDTHDHACWGEAGHVALSATPAGLLSGGLLPAGELDTSHTLVHPVPDLHFTL